MRFLSLSSTFGLQSLVLLGQHTSFTLATKPSQQEPLKEYRRRLGIDFKYDTKHVNPEMCRTFTEAECQEMDEDFGEKIQKNRKFLTDKSRRTLLDEEDFEINPSSDSNSGSSRRNLQTLRLINSGTMNVFVALIEWSDHAADDRDLVNPAEIEVLFNSDENNADFSPTGSIKKYFETASYGDFSVVATVATKFVTTDNTEEFYSEPNQGRTEALQPAFIPVMEELDDGSIDWSIFDHDGDSEIDLVVFLHSGYDGVNGGVDCQNMEATFDKRIAAHARSGSIIDWRSNVGNYRIGSYAVASSLIGVCQTRVARLGTITHEMLHPFGMPDLYDIEGRFDPNSGTVGGIANYDIMANPFGQGNRQKSPGSLSAWSRIFLGWADPILITQDGTYTARAVADHPDIYKIEAGYSPGEYLLIENRQVTPESFDEEFYVPGGITIYHVDENLLNTGGFGNSPRGGTFQSDWPGNNKHYPIALLQADGAYDLEQTLNGGESIDIYNMATMELPPGNGETEHSSATYPNTDAYAFGDIRVTGITIKNFRAVEADPTTFQFDIIGLQADEPTDPPVATPTDAPVSPEPTEVPVTPEPTDSAVTTESPSPGPTLSTIEPTDSAVTTESPSPGPTLSGNTTVVPASPSPTMFDFFSPVPTSFNFTTGVPSGALSGAPSSGPTVTGSDTPTDTPSETPTEAPKPTLSFQVVRPGFRTQPSVPPVTRPSRPVVPPPTFPGNGKGKGKGKGKGSKKSSKKNGGGKSKGKGKSGDFNDSKKGKGKASGKGGNFPNPSTPTSGAGKQQPKGTNGKGKGKGKLFKQKYSKKTKLNVWNRLNLKTLIGLRNR